MDLDRTISLESIYKMEISYKIMRIKCQHMALIREGSSYGF